MRKCKVIITLMICAVLIFCFVFQGSAYQYISYSFSPDNSMTFSDNSGAYIASADGVRLYIEKVAPDSFSRTLTLPYSISSYRISRDTASAVCIDTPNHQTVLYYYDVYSDVLDSFSLAQTTGRTDVGYALNRNGLYLCDSNQPNVINRYSYSGRQEYYYEFSSSVSCITQDLSGNAYAVSNNTLYRLDPNNITIFSGNSVYHYVHFLSDDILIDYSGNVFSLSSGVTQLFSAQNCGCIGCSNGSSIYLAEGNTVYCYKDSVKTESCQLNGTVIDLSCIDNNIWAFTSENGIRANCLSEDDFTSINPSSNLGGYGSGGNSASDDTYGISSDTYRIDYDNMVIYDIPSGTTISTFKDNVSYDGYTLAFYQDGSSRYSGYLSTAMNADFTSNSVTSFAISVNGELTGEGNVNSKDRNALMDYLLGSWNFSGAYLYAADINCDGDINLLDTVLICRLTDN